MLVLILKDLAVRWILYGRQIIVLSFSTSYRRAGQQAQQNLHNFYINLSSFLWGRFSSPSSVKICTRKKCMMPVVIWGGCQTQSWNLSINQIEKKPTLVYFRIVYCQPPCMEITLNCTRWMYKMWHAAASFFQCSLEVTEWIKVLAWHPLKSNAKSRLVYLQPLFNHLPNCAYFWIFNLYPVPGQINFLESVLNHLQDLINNKKYKTFPLNPNASNLLTQIFHQSFKISTKTSFSFP